MPVPHALPWHKLQHFCFSWGLSQLGGDELWDVSSEHLVLETPSAKVALTFNFIFSEKSEHQQLYIRKNDKVANRLY